MTTDYSTNYFYYLRVFIHIFTFFFICPLFVMSQDVIHSIKISPLYSWNSFNWSSAGDINGKNPNIMSELKWTGLQSYGLTLESEWRIKKIKPVISITKEYVFRGKVMDTDYAADNREGIEYQNSFESDQGQFFRLSIMQPANRSNNFYLGMSMSTQKLNLYHGLQNKKSEYKSKWVGIAALKTIPIYQGPVVTVDFNTTLKLSRYWATGNWIMRTDLLQPNSFKHYTYNGECIVGLKSKIEIFNFTFLAIQGEMLFNRSLRGEDQVYYANGNVGVTQFNGLKGTKSSLYLTISREFIN